MRGVAGHFLKGLFGRKAGKVAAFCPYLLEHRGDFNVPAQLVGGCVSDVLTEDPEARVCVPLSLCVRAHDVRAREMAELTRDLALGRVLFCRRIAELQAQDVRFHMAWEATILGPRLAGLSQENLRPPRAGAAMQRAA